MSTGDSPPASDAGDVGARFIAPSGSPPPESSGRRGRDKSRPYKTAQLWGLLLACLVVRLVALDADPPPWLSWSTGLYTDEGFYTLDARHEALFGTLAPGDFHDRLLSPLLSLLQQGVFSLFGIGLVQARLLSALFGILTVGVFWLGLRRAWGANAADFGALFLGLAPPFALYNRTALQETPTVFWLVLAFALWGWGARRPALYALAGLSVAVAMVFKGLALVAGGALVAGPGSKEPGYSGVEVPPALRQAYGIESSVAERLSLGVARLFRAGSLLGLGGLLLGLALYAAAWYGPHHAELSRMATYYRVHQMQPHSWHSLWLNVRRAFDGGERGVFPYLLATLPVPCGLAVWGLWTRKGWDAADRFFALWLAGGLGFCLLSSYAPSRYYVLFLPALAGLAARGLSKARRLVQIGAVAVFLLTSAAWYGAAWTGRSDARRDASRELARTLPPGSVVVGDFAPALCLDTPFAATTVQPGLANDDHPVERLKATHVVVVQNARNWQDWWRTRYPGIMQPSHHVATFELGGTRHYVVDVYAVKETR
jgi:4-amino-4-deoxy-L-arabinose transferase-like glycosyltransferase